MRVEMYDPPARGWRPLWCCMDLWADAVSAHPCHVLRCVGLVWFGAVICHPDVLQPKLF